MKLDKALSKLTDGAVEEILALTEAGLHKTVSDAEAAIDKATKERDAMPEYQKAGEIRKDCSASLNDLKKYQKAKSALVFVLLRERNDSETLSEEEEQILRTARDRAASGKKKGDKPKAGSLEDALAGLKSIGVTQLQINDEPPVPLTPQTARKKGA